MVYMYEMNYDGNGMESEAKRWVRFYFIAISISIFSRLSNTQLGDASPFLFSWENQKSEKKKGKNLNFTPAFVLLLCFALPFEKYMASSSGSYSALAGHTNESFAFSELKATG